ncbi:hypothetical protein [Salicibibacter halophilus]
MNSTVSEKYRTKTCQSKKMVPLQQLVENAFIDQSHGTGANEYT